MPIIWSYVISIALVALSALFSGLNLALMTLSPHELKRRAEKFGDTKAKVIYDIRKNGNLLLTTLLLGNVAVNAVLAIFLNSIASGVVAGLVATGLIFVLGEIIPQAVLSRHAMVFGYYTAPVVRLFTIILFPVCWPIAYILDKFLGEELPTIYSRGELMEIIDEHTEQGPLDADEKRIAHGAFSFSHKTVQDVMTPLKAVALIDGGRGLSSELVTELKEFGHSRFPVYLERIDNIIGVLYIKDLVGFAYENSITVESMLRDTVIYVRDNALLDDVLNQFLAARTHLFFVQDEFGTLRGIITIEDILEEILKREIVDETDVHVDMRKVVGE